MTEKENTVQSTPDPLLDQMANLVNEAKVREAAALEKQNTRSNAAMGDALKGLMEVFNGLESDDREAFAKAAASIAKKAQQHEAPAAYLTVASNALADASSAVYRLRNLLALLDNAYANKRNEVIAAEKFLTQIGVETFGPDALQMGFSEYQLIFPATGCTLGILDAALRRSFALGEARKVADELAAEAEAMLTHEFDSGKKWQDGSLVFDDGKGYIDEVKATLADYRSWIKRADYVTKPTSRRVSRELGAGDGSGN